MGDYDCPFRAMDTLIPRLKNSCSVIIVDFHAEATSEKVAMGRYLDGRVSAVVGTHTHVGTTDTRLFARGTAYISDIGMTGPVDSVIGDDVQNVLERFLTALPHRLNVASGAKNIFNSVLINVDEKSGQAYSIERIDREVEIQ
jgi:metallophosphoesterase (TIGR00282 family)